LSAAGQGRGHQWKHLDAGNRAELFLHLRHELKRRFLPLAPGLKDHAAKATRRKSELKGEIRFRETEELLLCRVGERGCLIDGRVGGRIDNAEDNALIFRRCQLATQHDGELEEEKAENR